MAAIFEFPASNIARGIHSYTLEMGQRKPNCELQMSIGHYGGYFIRTKIELSGRGIKLVGSDNGTHRYKVTDLAFEKLKQQYSISHESILD
ncbi:hypothetical protein BVG16_13585 [Paenibacillus selenitireducens]|uniref:Uncharacterized protein n=1 Tax=Paenibacillus selenitireducens TaxID=1324314 RepID=A0A1T2XCI0_9BACL|nr:hypothetical protein [Paenibacillus selenitireducens]OPA77482.1 hypothetical protein BVG16_13585 [Paenibacillus selenitireducens]